HTRFSRDWSSDVCSSDMGEHLDPRGRDRARAARRRPPPLVRGLVTVDPDVFRSAIGRLPAGVGVVSLHVRGIDLAGTVSAIASVSLEPALVLFCVHGDARLREGLDEVDSWVLSILADHQAPVADWFASPS